jgi:hypothetical protein
MIQTNNKKMKYQYRIIIKNSLSNLEILHYALVQNKLILHPIKLKHNFGIV